MKKLVSLLLVLVMVCAMFTVASAEDVTYKKEIRIGTLADLTVACRYAGTATVTTQTCNSTFNGLVALDAAGNASPELATEWTSNEDATEWTFVLREGVKFHDGSDFTAEDVKFTWDYASTTENEGISQPISGNTLVSEVIVDDTYQVTFKLNAPSADWLNYAAQDILSKTAIETKGFDEGSSIGTGPYYFDNLESGVSWTIRRFEDYWGEKPVTEAITFVVITDASSRALSLQSGDIDAMYDGNPSDIVAFMYDDNYNVFRADNIQVVYAGFNAASEYGANKIVRQAVAMAVNRDDILMACYEGGECGTLATNFISTVATGYVDVNSYPYDPAAAKALLEENGLGGITLTLYTFAKYIPVAEIMQANLRDIGVTLNIQEWAQTGFTLAVNPVDLPTFFAPLSVVSSQRTIHPVYPDDSSGKYSLPCAVTFDVCSGLTLVSTSLAVNNCPSVGLVLFQNPNSPPP